MKYPRIKQFGLAIQTDSPGPSGIPFEDIQEKLGARYAAFCKLFGIQTVGENGAYPHDVEAVLERMESGKLTGTQLHWD